MHFQTAEDFIEISSAQLEEALDNVTLKAFARKKVEVISELAKHSFGLTLCKDSFALQIRMLLQQIQFVEEQVS